MTAKNCAESQLSNSPTSPFLAKGVVNLLILAPYLVSFWEGPLKPTLDYGFGSDDPRSLLTFLVYLIISIRRWVWFSHFSAFFNLYGNTCRFEIGNGSLACVRLKKSRAGMLIYYYALNQSKVRNRLRILGMGQAVEGCCREVSKRHADWRGPALNQLLSPMPYSGRTIDILFPTSLMFRSWILIRAWSCNPRKLHYGLRQNFYHPPLVILPVAIRIILSIRPWDPTPFLAPSSSRSRM